MRCEVENIPHVPVCNSQLPVEQHTAMPSYTISQRDERKPTGRRRGPPPHRGERETNKAVSVPMKRPFLEPSTCHRQSMGTLGLEFGSRVMSRASLCFDQWLAAEAQLGARTQRWQNAFSNKECLEGRSVTRRGALGSLAGPCP